MAVLLGLLLAAAPAAGLPPLRLPWLVAPPPPPPGPAPDTLAAVPDLRWPLDLPERYLTSGFMEWRPGRFHAGIDLKTRSQSGFPVRAIEDGEVVRLRAAPSGYGLALHLRGRSGRTYVYAHLERLADRLRAELLPRQQAAGRWTQDVSLPPGALSVRKGEVLALSGESGTTGPHLHLEVRDAAERPLDPQDHGLAVEDRLRPRIRRLRALPVEPSSRLEGQLTAFAAPVPAGAEVELPALRVRGAVALAAEVEDAVDAAGHRLAPDLLRVWLDGQPVYWADNERFAFGDAAQAGLEWLELGVPPARWLHLWPGVTLPGRRGTLWSAAPGGLPAGRHQVVVEALDRAGNRAAVRFDLLVEGPEPAPAAAAPPARSGAAWRPDPVRTLVALPDGRRLWLTPFLELERAAAAPGTAVPAAAAAPGEPAATHAPGEPAGWVARPLLAPDGGDEGPLADGGPAREPEAAPGAAGGPLPRKEIHRAGAGGPLLADAALWVLPDALDPAEARRALAAQGLQALGPALRLAASWWSAEGSLERQLPPATEAPDPRDGVYWRGAEGWSWVASAAACAPGAGARFPFRGAGRYALLRDLQPPRFSAPAPDTVRPGHPPVDPAVTPARWQLVAVGVRDEGSGLDPATLTATLAGRPLLPQPDLVRDRLLIELPDDLPPGRHVVVVEAADRAGNRTRRELVLHLRGGSPAGGARR